MKINWKNIRIKEFAALICSKLCKNGIDVMLVGGACCTIYSKNKYQSMDIDFVSSESIKRIAAVLKELGFERNDNRYFIKDNCPFFIDFVAPPPAIGSELIKKQNEIKTKFGNLILLTPTDSVKDRLAAYYFWKDPQALEQALLIASVQEIDFKEIKRWSQKEGFADEYKVFLKKLYSQNI